MKILTFKNYLTAATLAEFKRKALKNCNDKEMGLSFNGIQGVLKWKTDYFHSGVYKFKITASDNDALDPKTSSQEFKVEVKNVNRPPKLSIAKNQKIKEMVELENIDYNDISKLLVPINQIVVRTQNKGDLKRKMRILTSKKLHIVVYLI